MDKRFLAKIPIIEASLSTTELACKCTGDKVVEAKLYGEKNELLLLYLFSKSQLLKGNTKAEVRMFIDKTDYITQDLKSQKIKWYTGTLSSFLNYYWKGYSSTATTETKEIIANYFNSEFNENDPYRPIFDFQNKVLAERLAIKHLKITKPIDELMETVPAIPSNFMEWAENEALLKSRYIYYQYSPKVRVKGFCTHCKCDVELYKPKHNAQIECPNCKSRVMLKSMGKSKHVSDDKYVCLLQKIDTGFIARYFHIRKDYQSHYREPKFYCSEENRDFFDFELQIKCYEWGLFKQKSVRWKDDEYAYRGNVVVYPYNINEIEQIIPYAGLSLLTKHEPDFAFGFNALMDDYRAGIFNGERLAKVGLFRLAQDYLQRRGYFYKSPVNKNGRKLNRFLGVENDDAKLLISADVNQQELDLFKFCRKNGKRLSTEQLITFRDNHLNLDIFKEIIEIVPVGKALKYLSSFKMAEKDIVYRDYLNSCKELKYDLSNPFVAFPKNLRERHDQNVETINEISLTKESKTANSKYAKVAKRKDTLNQYYAFENNKYFIRAPSDAGEIIREGHTLRHCVGGRLYLSSMAEGQTVILFLRRKEAPGTPYYTIQIEGNRLIQCHTFGNKDRDKSNINGFLKLWQKYLDRKVKTSEKNRKVG
ncbi:PcfJ domain-containing protein [Anaerovorax sp. IOR16]|uniref:PcfJ domain-containing protein n=1 Tax=Anaerovorax sp. IOR16 TaxID=2773458 RepID=UPI0019D1E5B4|nr:PcfJ domain-containing protein [Anaerovorax sp. IOR16]